MEPYLSPKTDAESELTEKKSVFIGHLRAVQNEEQAKAFVSEMKKKYADARHNVWAYRLPDGSFRSSDDGEPSGTGGAPVLDLMSKRGIAGCAIVITRYFGGILLGTGGLVRAYSGAAKLALDKAGTQRMIPYEELELCCSYGLFGGISRLAEKYKCRALNTSFAEKVGVSLLILPDRAQSFEKELRDLSGGSVTAEKRGQRYLEEE